MKESPLLSIIIPVYNAEEWLEVCVNSILTQTFANFELILVDDGSIDRSLQLCHTLSLRDGRIRVVHQNNAGPNAARNNGIRKASGKFLAFVDADDEFYTKDTLEKNIEYFYEDSEIDIVSFPQYREYGSLKEVRNKPSQLIPQILSDKKIIFTNWYNGNLIDGHFPGKIFRKSLFDGWDLVEKIRFTEDHYNIPDLCRKLRKVKISGVGGYLYKSNEKSAIHTSYTLFKRFGQLNSEIKIYTYLRELRNCEAESQIFFSHLIENAYYLLSSEYEEEAIILINKLSKQFFIDRKNQFRTILIISVNILGYKIGLKFINKIIKLLNRNKN